MFLGRRRGAGSGGSEPTPESDAPPVGGAPVPALVQTGADGAQPLAVALKPSVNGDGSGNALAEEDIASERITIAEMRHLQQAGEPVLVLDVRKERSYGDSDSVASGALRIDPDQGARQAAERGVARDAWLVAFCT